MTDFLVKRFVKDYEDTEKVSVRTAYGVLASVTGIFCNVLLFLVKGSIGLMLHSLSVTADAFNNLSDAGSSVIGLVGVKMASKPADKEHPFGHGRLEYIAALVVAFLVLEIGFTFFKEAIGKIRAPQEMNFQMAFGGDPDPVHRREAVAWTYFNRKLGKTDRLQGDAGYGRGRHGGCGDHVGHDRVPSDLSFYRVECGRDRGTGCVADRDVGRRIGIARDTLEPLLGEAVTPEEYDRISRFVEGYDGIVGSHDLIVHNYGPGRSMASIHAEVPNDVDIEDVP